MHRTIPAPVEQHASLAPRLRKRFSKWRRQRLQRRALERAYREFRATHTHCTDILFDMHFLRNRGVEALMSRDAETLAYAWTHQFCHHDERRQQRDLRQLLPACESFLELLQRQEAKLESFYARKDKRRNTKLDTRNLKPVC